MLRRYRWSPSQGASYYERDGYYAKDDPAHREGSAWAGRGAAALGLCGPVDPETFKAMLEGTVPDGSGQRLGRGGRHAQFVHRPGRDLTFSAPKSVSLAALEQLVSKGYTRAEKALAGNYSPGDVVAFHRPYTRLGVEKGEERRVVGIDHGKRIVHLENPEGSAVQWKPSQIGGRNGGTEVYRAEALELRAGDRIRWTRNEAAMGLVNSGMAEVTGVKNGRVSFRLEDGRNLELEGSDPQLRHLDRAWASTVHAFQGRTVDNVIAAMEAKHPNLTTQKSFYVEISRARYRAELVTDNADALREQLETVTGERISALEGIGEAARREREPDREASLEKAGVGREAAIEPAVPSPGKESGPDPVSEKAAEPEPPTRGKEIEIEMDM